MLSYQCGEQLEGLGSVSGGESMKLSSWDGGGSCQRLAKYVPEEACFGSHTKEEAGDSFPLLSEVGSSESLCGMLN